MRTATALLILTLAGAGAFGLAFGWGGHQTVLLLPASLGEVVSAPAVATPIEGVTVSPASLAFGQLRPNSDSGPLEVRIENGGAKSLRLRVVAAPLVNQPAGAEIPASAIQVVTGAADATVLADLPVVPPGGAASLWIRLSVPSGAEQYLPPGAYHGHVALHLDEVVS